jgi:ferrous iron transport protein B
MKRLALLGMPNTGKSTLFNRLTGASARVGNWPGVTVDLLAARILLGADMVEVVDLPGIYDLHGYSEDERVVRHFLAEQPVDLVAVVLNARQLDRQLVLALQLARLGLPMVVLVNMMDEARRHGVRVDTARLAEGLGCPVVAISAKYGEGQPDMMAELARAMASARATRVDRQPLLDDNRLEQESAHLVRAAVDTPVTLPLPLSERLDRVLMHNWAGLPLFFLAMFALFAGVFWLGTPLQDGMKAAFDWGARTVLEPALAQAPPLVRGFVVDGLYGGLATVAAFVPVIVLFFFFMAVVEDSGYLSRAAYLMDALMARLGLDGRSFVMLLMGFGCNVPAVMGTRIMRSRALRLLSMLVIPFSLCSARLQVFLFLIALLFTPLQAPLVLMSLYLVSLLTAMLTALLFGRHRTLRSDEPFVIELPPYRVPTLRQVWLRGWLEVRHFLARATRFIVLGVVAVWLLSHFPQGGPDAGPQTYAGMIGALAQPVFAPLGIDEHLTVALIFGFVAKEVVVGALAVIYGLNGDALGAHLSQALTAVQAYSFMLFCLVYTPCVSTIAAIRAESRSLGFAALSVGWSLALAWLLSFGFYQIASRLVAG